jgi:hypothetical protein
VVVGTDDGGHIGSVLGATALVEGKNADVVITVNPPMSPGTYLVGLVRSTARPTANSAPMTTRTVTVSGG